MKTGYKTILLASWVGFLFLISCNEIKEPDYTAINVLIDVTDEGLQHQKFAQENINEFLKLMQLDKNTGGYSGGEIKLSYINEVSDSKSKTIKIEKGKPGLMGENPLTRKDEVNKFVRSLEEGITEYMDNTNWGKPSSKIYQKVAREFIKLKRVKANHKYMIIYSDMLENSNLFSFYGVNWKNKLSEMTKNPEETLQKLSKKGPVLPDLSEFIIFVIVQRTIENDEKINVSEEFWTAIFEQQGATVFFDSELRPD